MSLIETVIEATLKPDGTLELDAKPNLPAGRVKLVLCQETDVARPAETPFWRRMHGSGPFGSVVKSQPTVERAR